MIKPYEVRSCVSRYGLAACVAQRRRSSRCHITPHARAHIITPEPRMRRRGGKETRYEVYEVSSSLVGSRHFNNVYVANGKGQRQVNKVVPFGELSRSIIGSGREYEMINDGMVIRVICKTIRLFIHQLIHRIASPQSSLSLYLVPCCK